MNIFRNRRALGAARLEAATWKGEAMALQSAVVDLVAAVDASLTHTSQSKALRDAMTAARSAAHLEDPRAAQFHANRGWGA
jgi:hypothetical protein